MELSEIKNGIRLELDDNDREELARYLDPNITDLSFLQTLLELLKHYQIGLEPAAEKATRVRNITVRVRLSSEKKA